MLWSSIHDLTVLPYVITSITSPDAAQLFRSTVTRGVNRTTVLGHVRRYGVPKRDRRVLRCDKVDWAAQRYAGGQSVDWVAAQLGVAASTVRRALKDAGVVLRPGGRRRTGHQIGMQQPMEKATHERVSTSRNEPQSVGLGASDLQTQPQIVPSTS